MSMREKIAAAIHDHAYVDLPSAGDAADAVLAVLENPSVAMIEAGNRAMLDMPIETESDRHIAFMTGFIAAIRAAREDRE